MENSTTINIKALTRLHQIYLIGQLIVAVIASFLVYSHFSRGSQLEKPLQVMSVLLSIGGFILGNWLFKKRLINIRAMQGTALEKFKVYSETCILQWNLLQGPCLFSLVSFLITGDYAFLCLAGALLLTFVVLAPSKIKVIYDLELSDEEAADL